MNTVNNRTDMAINTANIALGGILLVSPWLFGFRHEAWASLNAWISGGVVVFLALLAVVRTHDWEEWLNVIAGLWITTSPWLLWFEDVTSAFWTHIIIGLCIIAIAAIELCRLYLAPEDMVSDRDRPG
jgi:hypothetical protein